MTWLRFLACSALMAVLLSARPHAQPAAPSNLVAIPNYGTVSIRLEWRDNSHNERSFEIFRNADGGHFAQIGKVTADQTTFTDTTVNETSEYAYSVFAVNHVGFAQSNQFNQNVKTVWPVPASHEILHGWNDSIGVNATSPHIPIGFHAGVDIQRVGSGNLVLAPRGGVVEGAANGPNGVARIRVETGSGLLEFDEMNHLNNVLVKAGDVVKAGAICGEISEIYFPENFTDHTHFNQRDAVAPFIITTRHPFLIFSNVDDLDPKLSEPVLMDHVGSKPGVVLFRTQGAAVGDYLPFDAGHPIFGDVDIIVEAVDVMGTNPENTPVRLGYWIEPQASASCIAPKGVASSAAPYRLFDYTHAWFGKGQANLELSERVADGGQPYGPLINEGGEQYPWQHFYHYIVTNARATVGAASDVDEAQCWNTNASNDGSPSTIAHANFAGQPDTALAADARFPDGMYTLHVVIGDLLSEVDVTQDVRLENFPPTVCDAQPTGELPAQAALVPCIITFSEAMDTTINPLTVLNVSSGGVITNATWASSTTLTCDVTNLTGFATYVVTVGAAATDLPGVPGGNPLDGNKDGVAGDAFAFEFSTPPVETVVNATVMCIVGDQQSVHEGNQPPCSTPTMVVPTVTDTEGQMVATASASCVDSLKEVTLAASCSVSNADDSFATLPSMGHASVQRKQTWRFFSRDLPIGEPVLVTFDVSVVGKMSGELTGGSDPVGPFGSNTLFLQVGGTGWTACVGYMVVDKFEVDEFPLQSTASQTMLLINGVGVQLTNLIQVAADVEDKVGVLPFNASGQVTVTCRWLGVVSASTQAGEAVENFVLLDGCGNDWTGP